MSVCDWLLYKDKQIVKCNIMVLKNLLKVLKKSFNFKFLDLLDPSGYKTK